MTHILNIAFEFDDDKARAIAEKAMEQDMDTIIKGIILDRIAPEKYSYYGNKKERNWEDFNNRINSRVDAILEEHKQDIIDLAASKVCDSVKRTKVWREKYQEVLQDE